MTENARAPGALGFKTRCYRCLRLADVRATDGEFRYLWHLAENPAPESPEAECPNSDRRWEPE